MKLLDIILEDEDLSEIKTEEEDKNELKSLYPNWDYRNAVIYKDDNGIKKIKNVYCKIHKHNFPEGKSAELPVGMHKTKGTGCRDCGAEIKSKQSKQRLTFTDKQWIEKLSSFKEYKNKYDFSKSKFIYDEPLSKGPLVTNVKCKIHNEYFNGGIDNQGIRTDSFNPSTIENPCPKCRSEAAFKISAKSTEEWVRLFKSNKNNKNYNYSKCKIYYFPQENHPSVAYVNNIYCNVKGLNGEKHGLFAKEDKKLEYDGGIDARLQKDGQGQCPKCVCENRYKYFIKKSIESHKNVDTFLYDKVDFCDGEISKTINGNGNVAYIKKVLIGCTNHEKPLYFFQRDSYHKRGQGCPICRSSKGETYIRSILISKFGKKYKIIHDKINSESEIIGKKRFDFFIPKLNVAIEYDGIGHFEPTFGSSDFSRNKNYNDCFVNDNLKNTFIKSKNSNPNGIRLIRVPYNMEFSEIDALLFDAIDNTPPNQITYIGNYPKRQGRKEAVHKDRVDLSQPIRKKIRTNESKLSLIDTVNQLYNDK